jgi:hypothetical protein
LAPRHNPIHDLLSFLIAEKYKEPINKQPIVKPQGITVGTSTEPTQTPSIETKVEQVLEKVEPIAVHEGVQKKKEPYERNVEGRERKLYNEEIDKVLVERMILKPKEERKEENRLRIEAQKESALAAKKEREARKVSVDSGPSNPKEPVSGGGGGAPAAEGGGGGAPAAEGGGGGLPPSQTQRKVRLVRPKAEESPLGNVVAALQAQTDQEAGSLGNVDFQ